MVTGVSGSGKSSLAFDTLYAEGQRRYVESLSAYARQFLERIDKPDCDEIRGICPSIAIRQKTTTRNPRSTVGTVTEIHDYLRLLFSRIGITHCLSCGRRVQKDTPDQIADFVLSLPEGTRLYLCFPLSLEDPRSGLPRSQRGSRKTAPLSATSRLALMLPGLQKQGFVRVMIEDQVLPLADVQNSLQEALKQKRDPIVRVVVDRLVVREGMRKRLVDSLEVCGRESDGRVELILLEDSKGVDSNLMETQYPDLRWVPTPGGVLVKFSERFECQLCQRAYAEPEPRLFSFNNPYGACPECQGFGNTISLDLDRVIPDKSKSLLDGAIVPWTKPRYSSHQQSLLDWSSIKGIDPELPWSDLTPHDRSRIIQGDEDFLGILGFFDRLESKKYKMHVRIFISRYRGYTLCTQCQGTRISTDARQVTVAGHKITELSAMNVTEILGFFHSLSLSPYEESVAGKILEEIRRRLDLLRRVGLEYLTLDRLSSSLSGGESQRIQIASSIGSSLVGALYVLDEPSIGLHSRDTRRLIDILRRLTSLGNTVVVVEHDMDIMKSADYIIDLGPKAGTDGGHVVFQGSIDQIKEESKSLTAKYLNGRSRISTPLFRRKSNGSFLEIINATKHNLKGVDLRLPLGILNCISGVSGSGKSTLIHDVLYAAISETKGTRKDSAKQDKGYDDLRGAEYIEAAVMVDQSPIGKTPRSNPVTYIKAFDEVREVFAQTREAVSRSLGAGHFSFNLSGGRCDHCQGSGTITIEMQFLADVELTCDECKGTRYKNTVLEVRYKGHNIASVLEMTVDEALGFFAGNRKLVRKLRVLQEIGLGYLRLGQSATSLSGGEAQRIKLASYISKKGSGRNLFIFDEPTTGLHPEDIRKLLIAFDKLINAGNSIVVIEHNLDVVKTADWVIDLGPEGGDLGGQIVFEGLPEDLLRCSGSYTGKYLRNSMT